MKRNSFLSKGLLKYRQKQSSTTVEEKEENGKKEQECYYSENIGEDC